MSDLAFALRCSSCGGEAAADLGRGSANCQHCGIEHPIEGQLLERLRAHLQSLADHQSELERAATERDQAERERSRWGMPLLLRFFFPLLAGLWTIVSLGIGGVTMFLVMPTAQRWLGEEMGGLCAALSFLGVYALLLLTMRSLIVRKRRVTMPVLTATVAREVCPNCGGTVPVAINVRVECPFCRGELLVSDSDRKRAQAAVRGVVVREQRLAHEAVRKAMESGASAAQSVLDAVSFATLLPLLFVALPVALGRIVTVALSGALWPGAAQDALMRDQRDVVGMVISGVFVVSGIAAGIAIVVRRERRRRQALSSGLTER